MSSVLIKALRHNATKVGPGYISKFAYPSTYAIRNHEGVIVPTANKSQFVEAVRHDKVLGNKMFGGADMQFYDVKQFVDNSVKSLVIGLIAGFIALVAYKVNFNNEIADAKYDIPKFQYLSQLADIAVAERKAARAAAALAAAAEEQEEDQE